MSDESDKKVDALAADLDDLKLTVEELQDELPAPGDAASLATIQTALAQASAASDDLADRRDDDPWTRWVSNDPEAAALVARARSQLGAERVNLTAMEALEQSEGRLNGEARAAQAVFKELLKDLLKEGDETVRGS